MQDVVSLTMNMTEFKNIYGSIKYSIFNQTYPEWVGSEACTMILSIHALYSLMDIIWADAFYELICSKQYCYWFYHFNIAGNRYIWIQSIWMYFMENHLLMYDHAPISDDLILALSQL